MYEQISERNLKILAGIEEEERKPVWHLPNPNAIIYPDEKAAKDYSVKIVAIEWAGSWLWDRGNVINACCVLLNTSATIITVFLNKIVFEDIQLRNCQTLIVMYHFLVTFLTLWISTLTPFRQFERIRVPLRHMIPISFFFAGFLVLNNLSLTHNSIGFYQLAKILTTPCLVLLNFCIFRVRTTQAKLLAVLLTCVGVGLTTSDSAQSNPRGALIATAAFVVTALYQIWIGRKLQELSASPPQLLLNQSACSIILLVLVVPISDSIPDFNVMPRASVLALLASGFTAAMINLSQFLIIGRTSALTFNIVGMLKTVSIVSLGWAFEGKIPEQKDMVGVTVALLGAWLYATESSS